MKHETIQFNEELLDIVDANDNVIGKASRKEVHGNPSLIHRVVHVMVFNSRGELFLQKRGMNKDVQPGKWDTSVGGHLDAGERRDEGAKREMSEELGIIGSPLNRLYQYLHSNHYESELVTSYETVWDGDITLEKGEIEAGKFWGLEEIELSASKGIFTPNFLDELERYKQFKGF